MDQPQQNIQPQQIVPQNVQLQQYPTVGPGYSSSQPQQMPVPAYIGPPQGQIYNAGGPGPCCGICTLKTGCTLIGFVELVGTLAIILFLLIFHSALGKLEEEIKKNGSQTDSTFMSHGAFTIHRIDLQKYLVVIIVIEAIYLIFHILLLIGVSKEHRQFCIVWIVLALIGLLVKIFGSLLTHKYAAIAFLIELWFIVVVAYYAHELRIKQGLFIPQAVPQVTYMAQPTGAYQQQQNYGPQPPYSQSHSAASMQQNSPGLGQPNQSYPV